MTQTTFALEYPRLRQDITFLETADGLHPDDGPIRTHPAPLRGSRIPGWWRRALSCQDRLTVGPAPDRQSA